MYTSKHSPEFYNYDWLYNKYWNEELSLSEIGKLLNVNYNSVAHQMRKFNIPRRKSGGRYGDKNPNFKSGKILNKKTGYYRLNMNGQSIYEHRYVAEQALERKLLSTEIIHHINGIKTDNRVENLYMFNTIREHETYNNKLLREVLKQITNQIISFEDIEFKPITKSNLL